MIKSFITSMILCIILDINFINADCLACFVLKGVRITMQNGNKIEGYMTWFQAVYKPNANFPSCILDKKSWQSENMGNFPIKIYKNIYKIKYPIKTIATKVNDTLSISLSEVSNIDSIYLQYDGYSGASGIKVLSEFAIIQLQKVKPICFIKKDTGVSDEYLISYKKEIGKEDLENIYKGLFGSSNKYNIEDLEKMGIIYFSIAYD